MYLIHQLLERKAKTMNLRRFSRKGVLCVLAVTLILQTPVAKGSNFDFDNGNVGIEVIIPRVIPAVLSSVNASDATLILRFTTLITNAWLDAIAPYYPKAVGVYSRLGRSPVYEGVTKRKKNHAMSI